jgi:hypothetical protein
MATPVAPDPKPVVIESKPLKEGNKSRIFRADILCAIAAPSLWELGSTGKENTVRPVFLAYAASEQESRAFTANLRAGLAAVEDGSQAYKLRFEIPRSAGFRFDAYTREGGTLTLAYLPAAFSLQPSTCEQDMIRFLFMPPSWWVDREAESLPELGQCAKEAAAAAYFVAYLDQRSPLPIANDHRFHLELYRAALASDWCHGAESSARDYNRLYAEGFDTLGFEPPALVSIDHHRFSEFLAEQTARHLPREQEAPTHGKTRIPGARRLLPHSSGAAAQLGLFA